MTAKRSFAVSRSGLEDVPAPGEGVATELYWIHAKEVGTLTAACGLGALTWQKHWTPFQAIGPEGICPLCVRAVADDLGARLGAARVDNMPITDHRFVDL